MSIRNQKETKFSQLKLGNMTARQNMFNRKWENEESKRITLDSKKTKTKEKHPRIKEQLPTTLNKGRIVGSNHVCCTRESTILMGNLEISQGNALSREGWTLPRDHRLKAFTLSVGEAARYMNPIQGMQLIKNKTLIGLFKSYSLVYTLDLVLNSD